MYPSSEREIKEDWMILIVFFENRKYVQRTQVPLSHSLKVFTLETNPLTTKYMYLYYDAWMRSKKAHQQKIRSFL